MSTPGTVYNGTIDEDAEIYQLIGDSVVSATALMVYAHLIAAGREVGYIWPEPRSLLSWLYGLIRYPGLLNQLILVSINSYSPSCTAVSRLGSWSQCISQSAVYVFQILRTYAVCGKNIPLAVILTIAVLPAIAMSIVQSIGTLCSSIQNFSNTEFNILLISDLVFEFLVFAATMWGTWTQVKLAKTRTAVLGRSLSASVMRNGILYFGPFFVLQVWILTTTNIPQTPLATKLGNSPAVFQFPLRFVLSRQFILELHARVGKTSHPSSTIDSSNAVSTISAFHATVESLRTTIEDELGESLVHVSCTDDLDGMRHNLRGGHLAQIRRMRSSKQMGTLNCGDVLWIVRGLTFEGRCRPLLSLDDASNQWKREIHTHTG